MRNRFAVCSWEKLQRYGSNCRVCGQLIGRGEEYEVVKHKGPYPPAYFHTKCIKKEAQNNGTT